MMKQAAFLGMGMALSATMAFGQAALPAFYSGPWKAGPLPSGWTASGLRSPDYSENYDSTDGNAAGLDSSSDYIQVNFSGTPSTVSYYTKINGAFGASVFKVQQSVNGTTWTDVATYNEGNPVPTTATQYSHSLLAASRYVKFLYVNKVSGNVGLDGIKIEGPGAPSVTFTPAGSQSVPVSNLLTLAVSITPSGSGMKTWSLLPSYSGTASLANGAFKFTPASGDANQTFALKVLATNSVGTTTGTVAIAVTPYQPPVPVIRFSPAGAYSIMATKIQKIGIAVDPAGSGISSWTLLPSNYAGTAVLAGTNFTFTTAAGDGPASYTFTVLATNEFGTTTGEVGIAVSEYVAPPPPGAYICSFEDGSKTGYAAENITLSNIVWELDGILIGSTVDDLKIGSKSARLKYDPESAALTMTSQSKLWTNGLGKIALWYGPYGTHGENAPVLAIEISDSLTPSGWIQIGEVNAGGVSELTYASFDVFVRESVYVRIRAASGTVGRSANFDNITLTSYESPASNPYEAFLLQYNVTPGDPGTAEGEDWDGDGWTNLQEFNASPKTNPYDADSHP